MATITTYRVLIGGELTAKLPLVTADQHDGNNQEMCGWGYEGDFTNAENNGRYGEIWEFVTYSPAAMEQALNTDPAVVVFSSRVGGLEG
jgi:hypothetical protein